MKYVYKLTICAGFREDEVYHFNFRDSVAVKVRDYLDGRMDSECDAPYFRVERIKVED